MLFNFIHYYKVCIVWAKQGKRILCNGQSNSERRRFLSFFLFSTCVSWEVISLLVNPHSPFSPVQFLFLLYLTYPCDDTIVHLFALLMIFALYIYIYIYICTYCMFICYCSSSLNDQLIVIMNRSRSFWFFLNILWIKLKIQFRIIQ